MAATSIVIWISESVADRIAQPLRKVDRSALRRPKLWLPVARALHADRARRRLTAAVESRKARARETSRSDPSRLVRLHWVASPKAIRATTTARNVSARDKETSPPHDRFDPRCRAPRSGRCHRVQVLRKELQR